MAEKPVIRQGNVIYNDDERVAEFIIPMLPKGPVWHWDNFRALGVVRRSADPEVLELIGGVIFHNYRPHARDIEITAAFNSPRWCLPDTIKQILAFPIEQLGCTRCTARTARNNKHARLFNERLGFKVEGVQRRAFDGKPSPRGDTIMYGLLLDQFEWLRKVK